MIELRSESVVYRTSTRLSDHRRHRLQVLQHKMQEYIDNGTQLGWLIDKKQRQVFIYGSINPRLTASLNAPIFLKTLSTNSCFEK
ncbi:Uma2 family endonuclease [Nostoc sp.]|uniref:Uma2 family endonuclease n=1 Tax=Nostoc sp. TaxID=1180 RepID=UPI003FA556D9